jgi:hypothetical protein
MGYAVEILNREEALALPPSKRPLCFRVTSKIYTAAFEAVGAASLCWNPKPEGTFDSELASRFATDLCFAIAEELERLGITSEQISPMVMEHATEMEETDHSQREPLFTTSPEVTGGVL